MSYLGAPIWSPRWISVEPDVLLLLFSIPWPPCYTSGSFGLLHPQQYIVRLGVGGAGHDMTETH